jgi:hypothetical protein
VTFSTDVFHPLLTPLTTYTYTTGSSDNDTVSATDDERLPPGGFSLRHGFPQWFGRARQSAPSSRDVSGSGIGSPIPSRSPFSSDFGEGTAKLTSIGYQVGKPNSIVAVLDYIRTTFSSDEVLDSIPLEAAANPGAFHAWRTYRATTLALQHHQSSPTSPISDSQPQANPSASARVTEGSALGRNRRPGEWNWEGVWEERVKKAVRASLSEPILFGAAAGEDIVCYLLIFILHQKLTNLFSDPIP